MSDKKIVVWINDECEPGGIEWDMSRDGSARIYADKASGRTKATIIIHRPPKKK